MGLDATSGSHDVWCSTGTRIYRVSLSSGAQDFPDLDETVVVAVTSVPSDFARGDANLMPLLAVALPSTAVWRGTPLEFLVSTEPAGSLRHAPDIDGDGRTDLTTSSQYILTHAAGAVAYPLPGDVGGDLFLDRGVPLPDVTGDGFGDLLSGPYTDGFWLGYLYAHAGTHLGLYPGGPDGYATTPLWAFDLSSALMDAIALQTDDDPELEIMALGHINYDYEVDSGTLPTVHILDDLTGTPTETSFGLAHSRGGPGSQLFNVGDLDGDGRDDVLVTTAGAFFFDPTEEHFDLILLGSTVDYDPLQALQTFALEGGDTGYGFALEVVDVTDDGELDIVVGFNGAINVFHGPLFEAPLPADTADTASPTDTATTVTFTEPTSGTTATTPSPTDTTDPTPVADPSGDTPPQGCGCHAAPFPSSLALGLWLLPLAWRRRCGG